MLEPTAGDSIWCPYSDEVIHRKSASNEHIIPISLGGLNGFTLPVDAEFNSKYGSEIDGKLANDFLILFRRRDHEARGHSNKAPFPITKRAHLDKTETPIRVSFPESGLEIWDPIKKQQLDLDNLGEVTFSATFEIDMDVRLRFAAKVALGAGYLLYGDFFRNHVKHSELRLLMEIGCKPDSRVDEKISLRMYDQFTEISPQDQANNTIVCGICSAVNGSSVIIGHGPSNLVISVGILGKYIASVNVEAEMESLELPDEFNWGQVVFLQNKQVQRGSLRKAILLLAKQLGISNLPSL